MWSGNWVGLQITVKSWCSFHPKYHRWQCTSWHHQPLTTSKPKKYVYLKFLFWFRWKKNSLHNDRGTWIEERAAHSYVHTMLLCTHLPWQFTMTWFDYTTPASSTRAFCTNTNRCNNQLVLNAHTLYVLYRISEFYCSISKNRYNKESDAQEVTIDLWFIHKILMSLSKISSAFAISKATRCSMWSEVCKHGAHHCSLQVEIIYHLFGENGY